MKRYPVPSEKPCAGEFVPISVAANIAGVSGQSVRMHLNHIRHYKPAGSVTLVNLEDVKRVLGAECRECKCHS